MSWKNYCPILLAEDNPRDIELTQEALGEYHLANRLVVVHDGVELLDFLHCTGAFAERERVNPIVILLDLHMPRMDGLEALREIRINPGFKTIPVVMLTESNKTPHLQACYEVGVNAYVVKPVEFHQFVEVVKNLSVFWALLNKTPLA